AASSSAMESRPPETATATRPPFGSACESSAATARCTSLRLAGRDLLETAIGEDLVFARLEQRVDRLLLKLAQRLGQRLLERHHHRRMVAVRAARRLVDDLVDQAELLQPPRRDAERLGGRRRVLGRFPQ